MNGCGESRAGCLCNRERRGTAQPSGMGLATGGERRIKTARKQRFPALTLAVYGN